MTIKQQYMHERRRLQNAARRIAKEGIDVQLPAIPKNITRASVNRLAKITPQQLRESGTYAATGAAVDPQELRREQNRRRWDAAKRGAETRKRRAAERDEITADEEVQRALFLRVVDTVIVEVATNPWRYAADAMQWLVAFRAGYESLPAKQASKMYHELNGSAYDRLFECVYGSNQQAARMDMWERLGDEVGLPPIDFSDTPYSDAWEGYYDEY